jgi:RNA polymerase sigma-70 factor (ECF subfamily)
LQDSSASGNYLQNMDKFECKRALPDDGLAKCREKSLTDWSEALEQHRDWLRSVLAARLGDRHAVDEVWQEVAVAAVSSANPPDREKVAPWLYRVAIRRALMYRRGKGRQRRMMQSYAEQQATRFSSTHDPLDWLLSSERQMLVRRALGSLHHRDQEMLLLKYTQNWSYARIADHLGVTNSAVESRLHRARQKLRDELARNRVTSPTS